MIEIEIGIFVLQGYIAFFNRHPYQANQISLFALFLQYFLKIKGNILIHQF